MPEAAGGAAAPEPARTTRVLFVSHTAAWTGPTNSLWRLVSDLRGRLEPAVLLPGHGPLTRLLADAGVPFFSLRSLRKASIPAVSRLIRGRFDLVYGNNVGRGSENAFIASRVAGVPFVCHIRGMARSRDWRKNAFLRWADATVAVSEAAARAHFPYLGRRLPHVVHNGVDLAEWRPDRSGARARLLAAAGLPPDATVILGVAHLCPRKGQEWAVRAMRRIASAAPSAHLVLAGSPERDPAYADRLRARIGALGLEERVSLLGFRRDIASLIQGADVFLHTAVADPHPRAVLEAMAAGLPVVAFSVDGVAETVRHGKDGLLVPRGDPVGLAAALLRMAGEPEARRRMGAAGRRRVGRDFSSERTARRVGEVIEGAVAARGRRRPAWPSPSRARPALFGG